MRASFWTLFLLFFFNFHFSVTESDVTDCTKKIRVGIQFPEKMAVWNLDLTKTHTEDSQAFCKVNGCDHKELASTALKMREQYYNCLQRVGSHYSDEGILEMEFHHAVGITNQILTVVNAVTAVKLLNLTFVIPVLQSETYFLEGSEQGLTGHRVPFDTYIDLQEFRTYLHRIGVRTMLSLPENVPSPRPKTGGLLWPPSGEKQITMLQSLAKLLANQTTYTVTPLHSDTDIASAEGHGRARPRTVRVVKLWSPWDIQWDVTLTPLLDIIQDSAFVFSAHIRNMAKAVLDILGGAGRYSTLHLRIEEDFTYHALQVNVTKMYYIEKEIEGAIAALEAHNFSRTEKLFLVSGADCSADAGPMSQLLKPLKDKYAVTCIQEMMDDYSVWKANQLFDRACVRMEVAKHGRVFVGRFGSSFASFVRRQRHVIGRGTATATGLSGPSGDKGVDFEYAAEHGFQHPDTFRIEGLLGTVH